jgi:hypothetical protein
MVLPRALSMGKQAGPHDASDLVFLDDEESAVKVVSQAVLGL